MAIDFQLVKKKVTNDLSHSSIKIVDMVNILEKGTLFDVALTPTQISDLETKLKTEAGLLKTIAGDIKMMVG